MGNFCFMFVSIFCLLSFSEAFTPKDNYLVNCGSNRNGMVDDREFLADFTNGGSVNHFEGNSIPLNNPNSSLNSTVIYTTSRVFTSSSSYKLPIKKLGVHFVRFHFATFSSLDYNLKDSIFSVSVNKLLLLRNFGVQEGIVLKEFIVMVDTTELEIMFTPKNESGFAFVNGIEVFSAPGDFIIDSAVKFISPDGIKEYNQNLSLHSYETVHRINVGGSKLTPFNDTLWRTWVPDQDFLVLKSAAKVARTTHVPNYQNGGASRDIAPDSVYMTAQQMNRDNLTSDFVFNITWDFPVGSQDTLHFVRMHFCDIASPSLNILYFNVYIDGVMAYKDLDLSVLTVHLLASPYYIDFVVDSHNSGVVRISVGPSDLSSSLRKNAILNGVEVMKILNPGNSRNAARSKKSTVVLVGSVLGGFVGLVLVALGVLVLCLRGRKEKTQTKRTESSGWTPLPLYGSSSPGTLSEGIAFASSGLNVHFALKIPFTEIQIATNNFDKSFMIGHGGFGMVYKGVLGQNIKVAVKRGVPGYRQGLPEFQSEITILSKIRHRHLVSLVGYCEEQSEMILVYEYVEKGPLRSHLYGSGLPPLSWKQRLEICIGAARGIHYLHTGFAQGIIHRDIKSTNILLDENYVARVSDFGLSRSGPHLHETHVSTGVKGSFGYLDPEYFRRQQLTDKSDVYSFGVLLFEVLCARPAIDPLLEREQVNLAEWALEWQRRGLIEEIVDPHLRGQIKVSSLKKVGDTAEKCLADYGIDRPAMGDVLWNLEYALQLQENGAALESEEANNTASQEARAKVPPNLSRSNGVEDRRDCYSDISTSQVFSQLVTNEGR